MSVLETVARTAFMLAVLAGLVSLHEKIETTNARLLKILVEVRK